jgi:hypothetical protein
MKESVVGPGDACPSSKQLLLVLVGLTSSRAACPGYLELSPVGSASG